MLERLGLQGFKSFINQEIAFGPLVVLVGANASGKSNLLDAIRFLHGVGLDMSFAEILGGRYEGGREVWPPLRGGISEAATKGHDGFVLEATWLLAPGRSARHRLDVAIEPTPRLREESLWWQKLGETLEQRLHPASGPPARFLAEGELGPEPPADPDRSVLAFIPRESSLWPGLLDFAKAVPKAMRSSVFLDITPALMRGYAPKATRTLGAAGENVSAIAWQLCQDASQKTALIDWLAELCAPELVDLTFVETQLGDVMLELVERSGWRIPARSLSDGTLRFLGQLIALRTAEPGSILLIEEVDAGLHPSRVHLLVEAIEAATRERGLQVIATTHSPLVLAALSEAARKDAVLTAHDPDGAGTVMRRLGDLPGFNELAAKNGVDRMMTTGWLERTL